MIIDLYDLFLFQGEPDMKNVIDASIKQALTMHGDGLPQGEIQILHATPEQISQLQQAHHIQILQGDQIIQLPLPVSLNNIYTQNIILQGCHLIQQTVPICLNA